MIIQPKVRGFICTTAHPDGCARAVQDQIDWVKRQPSFDGPKKVLVVGASTGYGLASRIATCFGAGAATLGVFFERPAAGKRTATAGWYNSAAFHEAARNAGYYARSINGDAFSDEIKAETIAAIREDSAGSRFGRLQLSFATADSSAHRRKFQFRPQAPRRHLYQQDRPRPDRRGFRHRHRPGERGRDRPHHRSHGWGRLADVDRSARRSGCARRRRSHDHLYLHRP